MDDTATAIGFDFTAHMRRLCADMAQRLPELAHLDMARIAIRFCQTRKPVRHGVFASVTPLRFAGGDTTLHRCGQRWTIQRVTDPSGREMLYLVSFYLPRFLNLSFREKLSTVVHELWHISPEFNGDLRRHPGRCWAHSHSQAAYDRAMDSLADKWLALDPPAELHEFLALDFRHLQLRHGRVFGTRIRTPKLIRA